MQIPSFVPSRLLVALALPALLVGCRPRTPSYHQDVAPILAKHCLDCHRPQGIAPVPRFDTLEGARTYAQPIRLAVQMRKMPPFGVDNTGLCGTWQHARWLSSEEIATITKWQEAGAPAGEPPSTPPVVPPTPAAAPFRADIELSIGTYRPGLGAGGNRCFVVDPKLAADRYLSAIRISADDPRALAQVTLFSLESAEAEAAVERLDAEDAGPGYSCFGTTRVEASHPVASWTWPEPVWRFPTGTGPLLKQGRKLVAQLHYNVTLTGGGYVSSPRVALELAEQARPLEVVRVDAVGELPPKQRYAAVENRHALGRRMEVVGIAPRMHIRGETMQLELERGGRETCLATFDHWWFYNQQLFLLDRPLPVERDDQLRIACSYGTLGRTRPIEFGDGIDDEECVAYLFVTER